MLCNGKVTERNQALLVIEKESLILGLSQQFLRIPYFHLSGAKLHTASESEFMSLGKQIAAQSQTDGLIGAPEELRQVSSTAIPRKIPKPSPTKRTREAGRCRNKHPFT